MEIIEIAKKIEEKIKLLEKGRQTLAIKAKEKAEAIAEYDKKMAKTIVQLKNGVEFEVEGIPIKDPPVTLIERIAKGICWKEKLAKELAEAEYKNATVKMEAVMAELNGYQSINRYLEKM